MRDEAWELAVRRSNLPLVYHFAVCPHSPESGALLSEEGDPVLTDYSRVDWAGLAAAGRAAIDDLVPQNVKLYVADDAVDVMDVLNVSTVTGRPFPGLGGFEARMRTALERVTMKDMRAGLLKMAGKFPELHVNTPDHGKRPPAGALIVSLKFARGTQILDYAGEATEALFGAPAVIMGPTGFAPRPTDCDMPPLLAEWLRAQFGVVYGKQCTVALAGRTCSI